MLILGHGPLKATRDHVGLSNIKDMPVELAPKWKSSFENKLKIKYAQGRFKGSEMSHWQLWCVMPMHGNSHISPPSCGDRTCDVIRMPPNIIMGHLYLQFCHTPLLTLASCLAYHTATCFCGTACLIKPWVNLAKKCCTVVMESLPMIKIVCKVYFSNIPVNCLHTTDLRLDIMALRKSYLSTYDH